MNHILENAYIDDDVRVAFPDYAAVLVTVTGLSGGPSDERSEALLQDAEAHSVDILATTALDDIPEVVAWRDAYASFGIRPRVARSSFEALLRRAEGGLPRIDVLTDMYNALSVIHHVPIGGEDLDAYVGAPRLVMAVGDEPFDTREHGELVNVDPDAGEVVWRDDDGVTCRRWNWRQCARTRLTESTTNALFIFDGLGPTARQRVDAASTALTDLVTQWWPDATIETRAL